MHVLEKRGGEREKVSERGKGKGKGGEVAVKLFYFVFFSAPKDAKKNKSHKCDLLILKTWTPKKGEEGKREREMAR